MSTLVLLTQGHLLPVKAWAEDIKIIPLPIYATSPNEGDTYGFMPVFMIVKPDTKRTKSILAPSITYNDLINTTATFRYFHYPTEINIFNFVLSYSTNINSNVKLEFFSNKAEQGFITKEFQFKAKRSIFERYFGIGSHTHSSAESSYTLLGGDASARIGYNFTKKLNMGFRLFANRWLIEPIGIPNKPLTRERFAADPGMLGSSTIGEEIYLRYEDRPQREYSEQGWSSELGVAHVNAISGTPSFARITLESKFLWQELSWVNGALRAFWSYVPGPYDIPFYEKSTLGGEYRFRGFNGGRFYDKGAWELELEQRIRILRTHIYGVVADWRLDPFFAVGQVYDHTKDFLNHIRYTGGFGFRAWVHPNVVGRIDVGFAGEGPKIYVELGLPF